MVLVQVEAMIGYRGLQHTLVEEFVWPVTVCKRVPEFLSKVWISPSSEQARTYLQSFVKHAPCEPGGDSGAFLEKIAIGCVLDSKASRT